MKQSKIPSKCNQQRHCISTKRVLTIFIMLVITIGTKAQVKDSIDMSQFVAVYDYECRTQDDEGYDVTDKMSVAVQVGLTVVKSMPFSEYTHIAEISKADVAREVQETYMHMPTVWTGLAHGQTIVREFIFPHEYEGYEPTPEIAWRLSRPSPRRTHSVLQRCGRRHCR